MTITFRRIRSLWLLPGMSNLQRFVKRCCTCNLRKLQIPGSPCQKSTKVSDWMQISRVSQLNSRVPGCWSHSSLFPLGQPNLKFKGLRLLGADYLGWHPPALLLSLLISKLCKPHDSQKKKKSQGQTPPRAPADLQRFAGDARTSWASPRVSWQSIELESLPWRPAKPQGSWGLNQHQPTSTNSPVRSVRFSNQTWLKICRCYPGWWSIHPCKPLGGHLWRVKLHDCHSQDLHYIVPVSQASYSQMLQCSSSRVVKDK